MKKYLVTAFILITATAHADICTQKQNLTLAPNQPLRSAVNGWFQWLNAGTATCSGTSAHMTCTKSGATYWFDYSCLGSTCYVEASDVNGWRNEAQMNTGDVWGWTWDGWKQGYLQDNWVVCWPNACSGAHYGTCD